MRLFDQKFGSDLITTIPEMPGVYRFREISGAVIYVGKAKNLRRRLSQYRQGGSKRKTRKMRLIVRESSHLEWETYESHLDACLAEVRSIQALRPRLNIVAAYSFSYPYIGLRKDGSHLTLIFTTKPNGFAGAEFFGAFRSPLISRESFYQMIQLLEFVGHRTRSSAKVKVKGSVSIRLRGLPAEWWPLMCQYFKGEHMDLLKVMALRLLESPGARADAEKVQVGLKILKNFWQTEARSLADALTETNYMGIYPVPQEERDLLFIRYKLANEDAGIPS